MSNSDVPLDDKGKPWLYITKGAGVEAPQTYPFKPPGYREVQPQTVQRACLKDEDIINAVCEEEKELTPAQATARLDWIDKQLPRQPHSRHWKDVALYDEFHLGIEPQTTKRMKQKRGKAY